MTLSVVHNTSKPESALKKKSNQICYHFVREAVAANECRVTHIDTHENLADLATKIIRNGPKKDYLAGKLLYFDA